MYIYAYYIYIGYNIYICMYAFISVCIYVYIYAEVVFFPTYACVCVVLDVCSVKTSFLLHLLRSYSSGERRMLHVCVRARACMCVCMCVCCVRVYVCA